MISFEENLLEFQKAYKEVTIELQEIRFNITELEELENVFKGKEGRLSELVVANYNRLIRYKDGIKVSDNYKLEKRINLLNQIL